MASRKHEGKQAAKWHWSFRCTHRQQQTPNTWSALPKAQQIICWNETLSNELKESTSPVCLWYSEAPALLHPCNFCIFLQKLLPCLSVPAESADPAVPSSAHRSGLTGWQPEQNSHSPNSSSTSPLPFANTPVILQPFLTVHVSLQLQLPKVGENASSVFAERSLN